MKKAHTLVSSVGVALLAIIIIDGCVDHDMIRCVAADGDDEDSWLDRMSRTSSPISVQPEVYNHKGSMWIHQKHAHHKSPSSKKGRNDLEISDLTSGESFAAASARTTPKTIVVAKDGSGHFKTVNAAVKSISKSNSKRVIIHIKAGIYKEKVIVDQDWITFQGDGPRLTEIQWRDTATSAGSTFKSASVAVNGDHFTARDISFRNTAPAPPGGAVGRQAVALRISGDCAAFFNVNFYGAQDTLYDHRGRHYYFRCFIQGSIDMIFGNARSFYFQCRIHSIASPSGSLTAQKRQFTSENTGFSFVRCVVTGSGSIYLGRAWGPASRVVYSYTYFDNIILPQGWFNWGDPARQKTVFYAEYKCYGPGSNRAKRVSWSRVLTDKQALPFIHTGFINGERWLSKT